MPYVVEELGGTGIVFGYATPPFLMEDLIEQVLSIRSDPSSAKLLGMPMIVDLREVRLTEIHSDDLRRFASIRRGSEPLAKASFQAFIVRDRSSYGMVRMFGSISELHGLRSGEQLFMSENIDEVMLWMEERLRPDGPSAREIGNAIDAFYSSK